MRLDIGNVMLCLNGSRMRDLKVKDLSSQAREIFNSLTLHQDPKEENSRQKQPPRTVDREKDKQSRDNSPIDFAFNPVELLAALLTVILVGTHRLVHDSHTATMLPNFAGITLDEHTPQIIRHHLG